MSSKGDIERFFFAQRSIAVEVHCGHTGRQPALLIEAILRIATVLRRFRITALLSILLSAEQ